MKKADYPLITIGISCYKSADTAVRAIKSALAQDWPNIEILIADDGSNDDTALVIREAIKGQTNARLMVYEVNKGFAGSLNTIIAEAKGEFLAIFDDDDVSAPDRVRRQYKRITEYEKKYSVDLVICHVARIQQFQNSYERYEPTMGTKEGLAPHGNDVVDRILIGRLSAGVVGSCANCSRMARIELYRRMEGYNDRIRRGEDTDFNVRLGLIGGHFVGIAAPLVTQTMTMGIEKTLDQERKVELLLLEKNIEYLANNGWYSFCIAWLEIRYAHLNNKKALLLKKLIILLIRHPVKVLYKLHWIIPAHATRRDFKKWHHKKLNK